jgi:hypothetical protein
MTGYPTLSPGADNRSIVERINLLMAGKMNAAWAVTLTPGATTTTVLDSRIGGQSIILLSPRTATAAAAMATVFVSAKAKGSAELTHDNTADADRTFDVLIIG